MKLEMGYFHIKDVVFGEESKLAGNIVTVDKRAVEKLVLEDKNLAAVTVDIARPGESVRITPVKDVIEPRVKAAGKGDIFPGDRKSVV